MTLDQFRELKQRRRTAWQRQRERIHQRTYNARHSQTRAIKEACEPAGVSPSSVHKWVSRGMSISDAVQHVMANRNRLQQCKHKIGIVADADVINRFLMGERP